MGINVPAGAITNQYGPLNLAAGAISDLITNEEQRQENKRQKALKDLAMLVELHGPGAVNQPGFNDAYKLLFKRDWPTETVEIPAVTEEVTTKERIGKRVMPRTSRPEDMTALESQRRGERGQSLYGEKEYPIYGDVTKTIEKEPARSMTRPAPLGGAASDPTLGELGLPVPKTYTHLRVSQAKALGLNIDKLLFPDPPTREKIMGAIIYKMWKGEQLNPQDQAVLDYTANKDTINSVEEYAVREMIRLGGGQKGYDALPPYLKSVIDNKVQAGNKADTIEAIRVKIARTGIKSLTPGEFQLYMDEIHKRPPAGSEYSFEDMKRDLVLQRGMFADPEVRKRMLADPVARRILIGNEPASTGLADAQRQLREAEVEVQKARAGLAAVASTRRSTTDKKEIASLDATIKAAHETLQIAIGVRNARLVEVNKFNQDEDDSVTPLKQGGPKPPYDPKKYKGKRVKSPNGEIWESDGTKWTRVK